MSTAYLVALIGLGAFHGINPGMGWLFAVAIGLQERSRAGLLRALPVIAAGHAVAIGVVAGLVVLSHSVVTSRVIAIVGGAVVVGFGLWRVWSERHFRWAGMRLSAWQLGSWSFLMSSAHGAGLMLLPVLLAEEPDSETGGEAYAHAHSGHIHHHAPDSDATSAAEGGLSLADALVATAVHSLAMLLVAGLVAIVVYEVVGLRILRSAWINLDRIWAFALLVAGGITVAMGVSTFV